MHERVIVRLADDDIVGSRREVLARVGRPLQDLGQNEAGLRCGSIGVAITVHRVAPTKFNQFLDPIEPADSSLPSCETLALLCMRIGSLGSTPFWRHTLKYQLSIFISFDFLFVPVALPSWRPAKPTAGKCYRYP